MNKLLNKRYFIIMVIIFLACLLGAYGVYGFWQRYRATHNPEKTINLDEVTYSTDKPNESPPIEACDKYHPADTVPRKIFIPNIGVDGCIQKVGVDQSWAIAVPNNIHLAGWYINSPAPGSPGVSIIDGHVLGHYNDAIFKNLKNLTQGDVINIELGSGQSRQFTVVDINQYPVSEVQKKMFERLDGVDSQLTLITCGGDFDKQSQTYNQRVLVRARLSQ